MLLESDGFELSCILLSGRSSNKAKMMKYVKNFTVVMNGKIRPGPKPVKTGPGGLPHDSITV